MSVGQHFTRQDNPAVNAAVVSAAWWKEAVVYQIYPRSFMDSNGDGIGDLKGILSRLDYLKDLGIDVIWLSPIYQSPNDDNGYDISNYREIMDEFGTMEDFDELLNAVHARGMKLVMDLVANHTSDEHRWFVESRSSRDNPYRDYYIWRPGKDGKEPNNWESFFSGSTWQYDEVTGEYYLHLFSKKQPDLNWDNPAVRNEVYDMMKWWLDKGIDGFRMDVINMISKVDGLPDAPNPDHKSYAWGGQFFQDGPRVHEYLKEMNSTVLSNYDIMTVGETGGVTLEQAKLYTGEDRGELNMVFQFEHVGLDSEDGDKWKVKPWDLGELKEVMTRWQDGLYGTGWNSLYLNNHDQPRSVSRFGDDKQYRVESAKMLATFLHMQQGTPYVYQGEEIGMTNVAFPSLSDYRDVEIHNAWRDRVENGDTHPDVLMQAIHVKGRDNARTPMHWDDSENAGFTKGQPWIKMNPNYTSINVVKDQQDENSILNYYKRLIRLRKDNPIMVYGKYDLILADHKEIYAYTRTLGSKIWVVVCNFYGNRPVFTLPKQLEVSGRSLIISNYDADTSASVQQFTLRPYECRVYQISE
ncbi:alpha-glucosidase [Alicyclobacillus sp. SO9]|uniref:glycoside hydrolase family 13 protein n=1 Tax=Alicyclobacillus sp. SO9 TaxID=2665646 RepID=UPI0018E820E0|nr:alpha-glucosidase [Alicyclobacillus sp. SO9]QQE79439.1 alpha-glucosidase [Alicyclobacillus sp. SO9]